MQNSRPSAVAGLFYPATTASLSEMIEHSFHQAKPCLQQHKPKALIVPHAGYIYSGAVAASVYQYLLSNRDDIKRVVLIGPSHRVGFYGLALSSADYFNTPFGAIKVNHDSDQTLLELEGVIILDEAHANEHSLEVQLPFLQFSLSNFTIIPIVVGDANTTLVSHVIEALWGGSETLIVISSDLSHYHDYKTAKLLDDATSQAIIAFDSNRIDSLHACGCVGIRGLLEFAQHFPLKASIIDVRNSGDTAGSKDSVVGYGAFLFEEETDVQQ
ncbi:MAG: AmmeMemoRadiSam system protein B [Gammaproteobacteria bacterium]|nr:AmmeMemoRadiSam system protein B [Gammaproteobacteria bacterium]